VNKLLAMLAALNARLGVVGTAIAATAAGTLALSKSIGSLFSALKPIGAALVKFFSRWQEHLLWLPITVGLGLGAWVVLGALDPKAVQDIIPGWLNLPLHIGYGIAALAATHLVRRRWRMKLDADKQAQYWTGLMLGQRGPLVMFVADAVVTLCALFALLWFFSQLA
jgi:hypothetical protein